METFHYDNCGNVIVNDTTVFLSNLTKKVKTRTINKNGWKSSIKREDLRVHPNTYHRIGRYDHQFEGYDFYCYLCEYAGTTPSKCKCKPSFTVEENLLNINKVRYNYLKSVLSNLFPKIWKRIKDIDLSSEQVDNILYSKGKYDERILVVTHPPLFDFRNNYKSTKRIKNQIEKNIKNLRL